jgi:hypothetical protein
MLHACLVQHFHLHVAISSVHKNWPRSMTVFGVVADVTQAEFSLKTIMLVISVFLKYFLFPYCRLLVFNSSRLVCFEF